MKLLFDPVNIKVETIRLCLHNTLFIKKYVREGRHLSKRMPYFLSRFYRADVYCEARRLRRPTQNKEQSILSDCEEKRKKHSDC